MPKKHGFAWKRAAKAAALVATFALALLALFRIFGLVPGFKALPWYVTLGLPLGLAWLVAFAVGESLMRARHSLALATICLLVAAPIAWYGSGEKPGVEGEGEEQQGAGEGVTGEVLFKYEASFTYRGSEDNILLMGYLVAFPCPTVDRQPVIKQENLRWQLWGPVEGENGARWMELEVDNNYVFQYVGRRKAENFQYPWTDEWGFVHEYGIFGEPYHLPWLGSRRDDYGITWKIDIQNDYDNLYPGEQLRSIGYFALPAEDAERVTLEEDNEIVRQENGLVLATKSLYILDESREPPFVEVMIDISFQAKLLRKVDSDFVIIKQYSRELENTGSFFGRRFLELYPV